MQTYVYDDFTVTFRRAGADSFHVGAKDAAGHATESEFTMPMSTGRLQDAIVALGRVRGRDVEPAQETVVRANAEQLGGTLADALFGGPLGPFFDAARDRATASGRGIRLTLSLADTPELLSVPWELLYRRPTFLASQRRTPVVRYLDTGGSVAAQRIEGAVRVLGVVASPRGLAPLDVAQERARVQDALDGMIGRGLVSLDWCAPATPRRLREELRDGSYHILHYVGHSDFTDQGDGLLFLEDETGGAAQVTEAVLTNLLGDQTSLRLVILNSCEGARTTLTDPFAGIATSLVALGVPAVVAMQFAISDRAAIVFAEELFTSLIGRQYPIDAAVSEARKAVFTEVSEVEWATPVLFLRAADGELFDFTAAPAIAAAPPSPPVDGTAPAAPVDPTGPPGRALPPPVPPRRRRGPMIAGAAALGAAAIVVGVLVLRPDDEPPGDTATTVAGAAATTPATAAPAAAPAPAGPTCAGDAVPDVIWSVAPPPENEADLAVVQQYVDLVASARPDADNSAVFADIQRIWPGSPIQSTEQLTSGWSNLEHSAVRWIAPSPAGGFLVGQLVYDNATGSSPCRTGFLCERAVVDGDRIVTFARGTPADGAFPGGPYVEDRWFAPGDLTPSGRTAEEFLTGLCEGATYP